MSDNRAVIQSADMSDEMQHEAVRLAYEALDMFDTEKDVAFYIKMEFDRQFTPIWHCIVGCNFGLFITHLTRHFIVFKLGVCDVLLFKSA